MIMIQDFSQWHDMASIKESLSQIKEFQGLQKSAETKRKNGKKGKGIT